MDSDSDSDSYFLQRRRQKLKNSLAYTLCWQNISVWHRRKVNQGIFRKSKYKEIQLLNNVNGFVSPGSLVAIMGPSGSGKTTLLATISCRLKEGINGDIYLNGDIASRKQMLAISGFVPQEDLTLKFLTVYEHMKFMGILKMDKRIPEVNRLRKVLSLIDQLGLSDCGSTYIADLSGGQRKRLSIAVQMLTDPYLLFCDEATTGLDSSNAATVMNILRKFSSEGKIVICSIHQPASGIFDLFDYVLLLASGGRVSYFGPVNETVKYFERLQLKCPPSYNIAEFLISKVSISEPSDQERVQILCDIYATSKQAIIMKEKIEAICLENYLSSEGMSFLIENKKDILLPYQKQPCIDYKTIKRVNIVTQIYYLIWRTLKNLRRDYLHNVTHFIVYMYVAITVSTIYAKVASTEENREQNIRGFVNIVVLETLYEYAYFVFNTFPAERPIMLREIGGGVYTVEAYYLSKFICKTFYAIVSPIIFIVIVKYVSDAFDFLTYTEISVPFCVIAIVSTAYGCMMSACFDNVAVMMAVAVAYEVLAYLYAGVTLKISSIVHGNWLKYLSTFYYAIQAITVLEWTSIDLEIMRRSNITVDDPRAFYNLKAIADFGYSVTNYEYNLYILITLAFLFHYIAYLAIANKSKRQAAY